MKEGSEPADWEVYKTFWVARRTLEQERRRETGRKHKLLKSTRDLKEERAIPYLELEVNIRQEGTVVNQAKQFLLLLTNIRRERLGGDGGDVSGGTLLDEDSVMTRNGVEVSFFHQPQY